MRLHPFTLRCRVIAIVALIGLAATALAPVAPASAERIFTVHRLGGTDNIGLSVEVSRFIDPEGIGLYAMLGRGDLFADALASASMQGSRAAPLLLTHRDSLDPRVAAELDRLNINIVYILGGEQAITPAVEAAVQAQGYETVRVAGATRLETAVAIADQGSSNEAEAIVLRAFDDGPGTDPTRAFADSLAAGVMTGSFLKEALWLSEKNGLSQVTKDAIVSRGHDNGLVLGGPAALSEQVVADLDAHVGTVRRLAGGDRYETAAEISMELIRSGQNLTHLVLVDGTRGDSWAPGFTAAVLGTRGPTALLLSTGDTLPPATVNYLSAYGRMDPHSADLICAAYTSPAACDAAASYMN